ncbi:MAG: NUDIX domain-containing protein, partial [Ramlibacter sp.]|nr:NUDIX domain-containing protein [Cryobacterium sp.]
FWARKDERAWSVPKGEYAPGEDPFAVAKREFGEETGVPAPEAEYVELGQFRQPSGKVITVFAAEAEAGFRVDRIVSNTFPLEWPCGSGQVRDYPEIDDARWFTATDARSKLVRGQVAVLDALERRVRFGA